MISLEKQASYSDTGFSILQNPYFAWVRTWTSGGEGGNFSSYRSSTPIGFFVRSETSKNTQSGFESLTEAPRASSSPQNIFADSIILAVFFD